MKSIIITGGAGFIGANTAAHFANNGRAVTVIDNLSRKGSDKNLAWLRRQAPSIGFVKADVKDYKKILKTFAGRKKIDAVIHLAGQVAVTTSIKDPRNDFESNALGTFNVLEAIREIYALSPSRNRKAPFFINASTNKVYGGMETAKVIEKNDRYSFAEMRHGVPENYPLQFHSPYGCSKGTADLYVLDYSRIYGLKAVSFRQSCIYGRRQFGVEDQGWVAWMIIASLLGKKITLYGDGKQVRDILYVDDLINGYELAIKNAKAISGKAYNIGGGPKNSLSLLELIAMIEKRTGRRPNLSFGKRRPGDQPVYVSDIRKAKKDFGWTPKIGVKKGVESLFGWIEENQNLFKGI